MSQTIHEYSASSAWSEIHDMILSGWTVKSMVSYTLSENRDSGDTNNTVLVVFE